MTQTIKRDAAKVIYLGGALSEEESRDAWSTPAETINRIIRPILGHIDLDPFSSEEANSVVKARRFFTLQDSAFDHPEWCASTVFMNPPYSRGICAKATRYLSDNFDRGRIKTALVLVNNLSDTLWFQDIARRARRICLRRGRIAFRSADNKSESGNTHGTAFLLLCQNKITAPVVRFDAIMPDVGLAYGRPIESVQP